MVCIVHLVNSQITGWIIAPDIPEARRRAQAAGLTELAAQLYRIEFTPPDGKHDLGNGYVMLVD